DLSVYSPAKITLEGLKRHLLALLPATHTPDDRHGGKLAAAGVRRHRLDVSRGLLCACDWPLVCGSKRGRYPPRFRAFAPLRVPNPVPSPNAAAVPVVTSGRSASGQATTAAARPASRGARGEYTASTNRSRRRTKLRATMNPPMAAETVTMNNNVEYMATSG